VLWDAFAREERRKIYQDGAIRLWGERCPVPEQFTGQYARVRILYDRSKIRIGLGNKDIAASPCPP